MPCRPVLYRRTMMGRQPDEDGMWALTCDVCGDGWYDLDGDVRFSELSDLEAFAALEGWQMQSDEVRCSACSLVLLCARVGHRWGEWSALKTLPDLAMGRRVRFCLTCSTGIYDPPLESGSR